MKRKFFEELQLLWCGFATLLQALEKSYCTTQLNWQLLWQIGTLRP